MLRKAGSIWVEVDRFFDRDQDFAALREHVEDGIHTLITASRRMGKTSLVRALLRRLAGSLGIRTEFANLEAASSAADAILGIGVSVRPLISRWERFKDRSAKLLGKLERVEVDAPPAKIRLQLRRQIQTGNWMEHGDRLLRDLTRGEERVVLALDELLLLVNIMLTGPDQRMTAERIHAAHEFLLWPRKSAQAHSRRFCLIGSIVDSVRCNSNWINNKKNLIELDSVVETMCPLASNISNLSPSSSSCLIALSSKFYAEIPSTDWSFEFPRMISNISRQRRQSVCRHALQHEFGQASKVIRVAVRVPGVI